MIIMVLILLFRLKMFDKVFIVRNLVDMQSPAAVADNQAGVGNQAEAGSRAEVDIRVEAGNLVEAGSLVEVDIRLAVHIQGQ
jgi:hypothetical protein